MKIERKEDKLVVKHNKLVEFKGKMTTNELKLLSLIIADIREQQEEQFEEYKINLSVLESTTKNKNFYNYMKEVALNLEDRKINVEGLNENKKRYFTTIRLINKPRYTEGSKDLVINIDKDLIPYIIDLKREFTRYQIENILKLNSTYAVRIYELLKQYESISKREIHIENLREYLGIETKEYTRFSNFEARVLKVAKKEINKHTDINIDYEKIKKGRSISKIRFTIKPNEDEQDLIIKSLYSKKEIGQIKEMSGLSKEKFNDKQIIELYTIAVQQTDSDDIDPFEYIRLNYADMIRKGTAKNKFAYLTKSLKEDHADAKLQISFNIDFNEDKIKELKEQIEKADNPLVKQILQQELNKILNQ